MVVMGIALCIAWFIERLPYRIIPLIFIGWWLWYTYFSQIISGYLSAGSFTAGRRPVFALFLEKTLAQKCTLLLTGFFAIVVVFAGGWLLFSSQRHIEFR